MNQDGFLPGRNFTDKEVAGITRAEELAYEFKGARGNDE